MFKNGAAFRAWLERHHQRETSLLVRIFKAHALKLGVGYAAALDEALAFGWIDGVRRGLDENSFSIRFSPRTTRSIWSKANVAHVARLQREGRMTASGVAAFEARDAKRTGLYSFEQEAMTLAPAFLARLRRSPAAWKYWQAEAPSYRKTATHWVMSAKREETRERRLAALLACSAEGQRVVPLRRS
ncbi:MAG: YdeI/OmpD-associated family protein [Gemmatimonadota bacterium]